MTLSPQQPDKDEFTLQTAVRLQNVKVKHEDLKATRRKSHAKLPQAVQRTGWRSESQRQGEAF